MITSMLTTVICDQFNTSVGKQKHETGEALHIGFGMTTGDGSSDQYRVIHMYIYAPCNYVFVATQEERIDEDGNRHVGQMDILSYHDSCWRDAISQFLFENREEVLVFNSLKLGQWYDVVMLTEDEKTYLQKAEQWTREYISKGKTPCPLKNPFDNRGIWAGK